MQERVRTTFLLGVLCLAGSPSLAQQPEVVRVVAERFVFTPSRITVSQGSTIELRLRSEDTSHGFRIAGTDIDVVIPKRRQGEVTVIFEADTPGRYRFECSKLCGAGHNFMRGTITVETASAETVSEAGAGEDGTGANAGGEQ